MDLASLSAGVALALPIAAAVAVDRGARRRGTMPPGLASRDRRAVAAAVLAAAVLAAGLLATVSMPLLAGLAGAGVDPESLGLADLFAGQLFFAAAIAGWAVVAFPGREGSPAALRGLGLATPRPGREIGVGLVAGALGWAAVLMTTGVVAMLFVAYAGAEAVDELAGSPALVAWMAALPAGLRLALALAAGCCEELFFRGLLQPRIGIAASTALFVAGHVAYGQPFLLCGVALLSLICAALVRWRGNVLPAIVAHALFDAVQLLVVIPWVMARGGLATPVAAGGFW